MKVNKKAQATAFVIMGLVILAIAILVFYFRSELTEILTRKPIEEVPIPLQSEKVNAYAESCLKTYLEESVLTIGLQGGFINIPEDEFPPLPYNMLSNSIDVFGNGALRVPYWYYRTPNNIERTRAPTIKSMEEEISNYIDSNLNNCLNDFLPLKLEGYKISSSEPKTTTIIGDNAVIAETNMNIDVEIKEQFFTFKNFKVTLNSPLGKLYKRALEIFEFEQKNFFIENTTLDFMRVYDQIPFSGIDFECSPRTWLKSQVAVDLKTILAANIPMIKIKGTEYGLTNPFDKMLVFTALKDSGKGITTSFRFSQKWPVMMDVVGEDNEVLRGKPFTTENEASKFLMPLFCLNDYHFVYDIKYPILIALEENDFIFQYALIAVIDNNQPRENTVDIPLTALEDTEICENKPSKIRVIAQGIAMDNSLIPLDEVQISLQCLRTECPIGTTKQETDNSLIANFPACVNAQLIARKDGYHAVKEIVDTNKDATFSLSLEPYYELPVSVSVIDNTDERTPYHTEQILFLFENEEKNYQAYYHYPSQQKIKLKAGDYKVSSTLTVKTESGFKIKEETIEICVDAPKKGLIGLLGGTEKKCMKQKVEGTTMDAVITGGGTYSWTANRRDLAIASKITLYTFRGKTPTTITEINEYTSKPEQFSRLIRKPTFE